LITKWQDCYDSTLETFRPRLLSASASASASRQPASLRLPPPLLLLLLLPLLLLLLPLLLLLLPLLLPPEGMDCCSHLAIAVASTVGTV
jgi:hypothetical protein